jgi:hypothetical protein
MSWVRQKLLISDLHRLLVLALAIFSASCATHAPVFNAEESLLSGGIPNNSGLLFGRIKLEGGWPSLSSDSKLSMDLHNVTTGQKFTHRIDHEGNFFLLLPPGQYDFTRVWAGRFSFFFRRPSEPPRGDFPVPLGCAVYLGSLYLRCPPRGQIGPIHLSDEFEKAQDLLEARYPVLLKEKPLFINLREPLVR